MAMADKKNEENPGIVYGNVSNGLTSYGDNKLHGTQGHGYAAERANTLYDILHGDSAVILGDDNAKNGADRLVNGVSIQSKYCVNGKGCINACFENGRFRYFNADGTPMVIEVPADEKIYNEVVKVMEQRIRHGDVPGVTDPAKAKELVRRGHFTYSQAKNIAKAGTVESLTYDAANGMIVSASAFGISATLSFAVAVWNGEDVESALESAVYSGLKVGGVTFLTSILSGQASKAGLNVLLKDSSDAVVRAMGPKVSAYIANALRSGKNIYGVAAMNSTAKLLRSNIVTSVISVAVLSSVDVANLFRGRISGAQLFKNVSRTAASVAGGSAGWVAGATIGSILGPIGTVVGGLAGAYLGGSAADTGAKKVLDQFIEEDAEQMIKIIRDEFTRLAQDNLLGKEEGKKAVEWLSQDLTGDLLKRMYASGDESEQRQFAGNLVQAEIDKVIAKREKVSPLTSDDMQKGLALLLE